MISALLLLPALLLTFNFLLPESTSAPEEKKKLTESEKTVIVTEARKRAPGGAKKIPQHIAASMQDAIKQGNYTTAYMQVTPKDSPEYKELNKMLADENRKLKKAGLRKDQGVSQSAPIRYFDESTPRDRSADAIYLYFVEIARTFWPHFCIQVVAKSDPQVSAFLIDIDGKTVTVPATPLKVERGPKGVAVLYDLPLDKQAYDIVQALIKSKKATLTVVAKAGKTTRTISDNEIKGFSRIIEGFEAVGGSLNYLKQEKKPAASKKVVHAK